MLGLKGKCVVAFRFFTFAFNKCSHICWGNSLSFIHILLTFSMMSSMSRQKGVWQSRAESTRSLTAQFLTTGSRSSQMDFSWGKTTSLIRSSCQKKNQGKWPLTFEKCHKYSNLAKALKHVSAWGTSLVSYLRAVEHYQLHVWINWPAYIDIWQILQALKTYVQDEHGMENGSPLVFIHVLICTMYMQKSSKPKEWFLDRSISLFCGDLSLPISNKEINFLLSHKE